MTVEQVRSLNQCISEEERKQRFGIAVINLFIWSAIVLFFYKTGKYKCARELTCDNAGYAAAGDPQAAKSLLKKRCAGKSLHCQLSDETLVGEGNGL